MAGNSSRCSLLKENTALGRGHDTKDMRFVSQSYLGLGEVNHKGFRPALIQGGYDMNDLHPDPSLHGINKY